VLVAAAGASLAVLSAANPRGAASRLAFAAFWLGAGFLSGRVRIAEPAEEARRAFSGAGPGPVPVRVEGQLADFWSAAPPRGRRSLDAGALGTGGATRRFSAEVAVFVSGDGDAAAAADRGDRVRLTGGLEREDLPASGRDVPLPWPRYQISVKSARLVE